jgi:hypothetical protein
MLKWFTVTKVAPNHPGADGILRLRVAGYCTWVRAGFLEPDTKTFMLLRLLPVHEIDSSRQMSWSRTCHVQEDGPWNDASMNPLSPRGSLSQCLSQIRALGRRHVFVKVDVVNEDCHGEKEGGENPP